MTDSDLLTNGERWVLLSIAVAGTDGRLCQAHITEAIEARWPWDTLDNVTIARACGDCRTQMERTQGRQRWGWLRRFSASSSVTRPVPIW